ncbi:MAG TPA: Mur ligase domain-containing protein, partial [Dehalococcoidia bacterium]|nr:Mur ligase domain-containing protein [Dehalococcoidia bacterium]
MIGFEPSGLEEDTFSNVVTDSRKAGPGSLFVALKGERVDGRDFAGQAVDRGARGLILEGQGSRVMFEGQGSRVMLEGQGSRVKGQGEG